MTEELLKIVFVSIAVVFTIVFVLAAVTVGLLLSGLVMVWARAFGPYDWFRGVWQGPPGLRVRGAWQKATGSR